MRVILIDDEPIGLDTLRIMLERMDLGVQIVAYTTDPEKGIDLINTYRPEMVFLDINMPGINGFELINRVSYQEFKLVFTTAHDEYAIRAIKQNAFDYLLKPIDAEELEKCIINYRNADKIIMPKTRTVIELSVNDGIVFIKQEEIIRLEAQGSYCNIYLKNGIVHVASKNLKFLEALLDENVFFRCHQSHIINISEITKLISNDGYQALMSDNSKADVSKRQKDELLLKLKLL